MRMGCCGNCGGVSGLSGSMIIGGGIKKCWNGQEVVNIRDCPPQPIVAATTPVATSSPKSPTLQVAPQAQKEMREVYIPQYTAQGPAPEVSQGVTYATEQFGAGGGGGTGASVDTAQPEAQSPAATATESKPNWLVLLGLLTAAAQFL